MKFKLAFVLLVFFIFVSSVHIVDYIHKERSDVIIESFDATEENFNITETEEILEKEIKEEVTEVNNFINCEVPENNTIKSYMDYRCITLKSSNQYKLQESLAYTDEIGLRMVNDRYCVALGSYYTTTVGQYVDIELENGAIIKGILADLKDDRHTDEKHQINPNGSVLEFVVDTDTLNTLAKKMGDISYVNGWNSKVVNIKVYDKVENF